MQVSLAVAIAEDKGGKCFTGSHMRYYYIQTFRNKTQKSEKPSGIALKGIQNCMDFQYVEKWFKCTELFTAFGFYFLCELYLNKDFIIVTVVHAAIVKFVSISITTPLFQLGFIIQLQKSPWAKGWHMYFQLVVVMDVSVIKYVVNIQINIYYFLCYEIFYWNHILLFLNYRNCLTNVTSVNVTD